MIWRVLAMMCHTLFCRWGFPFLPSLRLPTWLMFTEETQRIPLGGALDSYVLFVTIFPHLIAGPIINYRDMMPQFCRLRNFVLNYRNLALGIALFTMGLFKKVCLADKLSPWVASVFSHADSVGCLEAWSGAIAYTYQLYFDFSGYSEMAIGLGLMFNLHFPTNFNSPYQASSIIDFWRRWHMTLGSWVKNYLYIPMGGNRHGELKKMRNLFIAMLLIGFWHGAGWTFILWGALHGFFLMINHQWRRTRIVLPKVLCWSLTFLCVVICWVFFRAETFAEGFAIVTAMFSGTSSDWHIAESTGHVVKRLLLLTVILVFAPNPQQLLDKFRPNKKCWCLVVGLMLWTLLHFSQYSEFLYFQF